MRCLGLYTENKKECERFNWKNKLTFLENLLDRWKERHLTIFTKVVVVKSLTISQLVLNFSLLNVPNDIIKRINRLIYNFIWKSKDRIKQNVLFGNQEKGGINMVDVESKIKALKAASVSRISDSSNSKMSAIFRIYLKEIGINLQQVLLMNFQHEKEFTEIKRIPTFYRESLLSYNQTKNIPVISNMTSSVFMSQIICGNRLFTENVKCLYIKSWVNSNILYVKDLFDESEVFLNENVIVQRLVRTDNWMIEYLIVKKCILPLCHQFDASVCQYINNHKINQNNRIKISSIALMI